MGEIIAKIIFFIFILPILILGEGYDMFKNFMAKRGYTLDWAYVTLAILVIILIILVMFQYGYR